MSVLMSRTWWIWALRGVVALLFGLVVYLRPEMSLTGLLSLFGAYAFLDGLASAGAAVVGFATVKRWWLLLVQGLTGVAIGIYAFVGPEITALALAYLIAARAIAVGLFEMLLTIWLAQEVPIEWPLVLNVTTSLVVGIALAAQSGAGALARTGLIAVLALLNGMLLIILAFRLRNRAKLLERMTRADEKTGFPFTRSSL